MTAPTIVAGIPIPSSDPAFLAVVGVHVLLGLACTIAGIVAMLSPKRTGRHPTFGSLYYWCLCGAFVTASTLAAVRWSFEVIAREWYGACSAQWAPNHGDRILRRSETYVLPWIGWVPIREVSALDVLELLRRLEQQNTHETARRVLRYCRQSLRYAITTGRADTDVLSHLHGALAPRRPKHRASVRTPKEVSAVLRAIDGYDGRVATRLALRFAALVFVRPGCTAKRNVFGAAAVCHRRGRCRRFRCRRR
jgi:hypothetical protein